jgi:hypothetical protein
MSYISRFRYHYGYYRLDKPFRKSGLPSLTSEEKSLIKQTWHGLDFSFLDYTWPRIYKKENGFSPYYLGAFQGNIVRCALNPMRHFFLSIENKAMCDVWFPDIPFPDVLIRCMDGVFYNKDMHIISEKDVKELLSDSKEFVIKPSLNTGCGVGVKKVKIDNLNGDLWTLINDSKPNFIVQKVLQQEEAIADLNSTSLNCCRITSLYINGKYDYSSIMKIGKKGVVCDNWNSSYFIGMDKDGFLFDIGYDIQLNKVKKTDGGRAFSGIKVSGFDKMASLVERCHKNYFPFCGIIGWDVICNQQGNPIVVEANVSAPGLVGEQLVSGPFFEPFVEDICERITGNK